MCDALSIAGLALSVGGTIANNMAQNRVEKARNDALAAERIRQQGLDREADALNVKSQDRYQDFQGQQETKADDLGSYFVNEQTPEPAPAAAMPVSQSAITVQEEGTKRGEARDFTNAQGEALGNLRAFGDLLGSIGRDQARDAGYIGQVGGFKRGSSNVLPFELDAASRAGDSYKTLGDVLGGLGSVAGVAGASGVNPFGNLFGAVTPTVNAAGKSSMVTAGGAMSNGGLNLGSLYGAAAKSQARVPFG